MRQSSVVWANAASQTVNANNEEKKEKVIMRKSLATALALTVALAVASPVAAAPKKDRTAPPAFSVILKKLIKDIFGVANHADPTVPIPKQ